MFKMSVKYMNMTQATGLSKVKTRYYMKEYTKSFLQKGCKKVRENVEHENKLRLKTAHL